MLRERPRTVNSVTDTAVESPTPPSTTGLVSALVGLTAPPYRATSPRKPDAAANVNPSLPQPQPSRPTGAGASPARSGTPKKPPMQIKYWQLPEDGPSAQLTPVKPGSARGVTSSESARRHRFVRNGPFSASPDATRQQNATISGVKFAQLAATIVGEARVEAWGTGTDERLIEQQPFAGHTATGAMAALAYESEMVERFMADWVHVLEGHEDSFRSFGRCIVDGMRGGAAVGSQERGGGRVGGNLKRLACLSGCGAHDQRCSRTS